jgi:ATP-dependent DNA helicase RecQ
MQMDKARLYEFQVASAKFDPIIKSLLRLYGAELFGDFLPVSETAIGKALKTGAGEVRDKLAQLMQLQVLSYEPASEQPQITFLTARQDADRLALNTQRIAQRRDLALQKMEAMINFAEQSHRCRMQVVLEYFDEHSSNACGRCDVCLDKMKSDNRASISDYHQQINHLLHKKPMTVDELETAVNPSDHHLFVEVVREMVDDGKIAYDDYWVLRMT